jgi:Na+/phosphate symporter
VDLATTVSLSSAVVLYIETVYLGKLLETYKYIRQVLGSNLGQCIGYSEIVMVFLSPSRKIPG